MGRTEQPILVVEDTPAYATLTKLTLKRYGFDVEVAPDGESAVTYLEQTCPALVLLDLNLPGMSGWDVLESLVMQHGKDTVPVIVMTAYSDSANRVVGRLQDIKQYLVKPVQPDDLRQAVERALGLQADT